MTDEELKALVTRLREEGLGWNIGPALLCQTAALAIDELMEQEYSANGVADLAIKHRDAAEARAAQLEAALRPLVRASSRLSVAAQTACGVAGRDEGLCAEIDRIAQPLAEACAVLADNKQQEK